jgi:hypothetical protein
MTAATQLVALRITYDPADGIAPPEKWNWVEVLDATDGEVELVSAISDADDVNAALSALFKRVDDVNENWERGDLAGALNDLNDQRAYTEALLVRVGVLTGKKKGG